MNPLLTEPAADAAQVDQYFRQHVNSGYARLASLMNLPIEQSSHGVYIYDSQGRKYLDAGGYGVFFLGHGHPVVVAAVTRQLQQNALASKLLLNPQQAFAAQALAAHCPGNLDYVFFCNSGAEATEAGLKLARLNGCRRTLSTLGGSTARPSAHSPSPAAKATASRSAACSVKARSSPSATAPRWNSNCALRRTRPV